MEVKKFSPISAVGLLVLALALVLPKQLASPLAVAIEVEPGEGVMVEFRFHLETGWEEKKVKLELELPEGWRGSIKGDDHVETKQQRFSIFGWVLKFGTAEADVKLQVWVYPPMDAPPGEYNVTINWCSEDGSKYKGSVVEKVEVTPKCWIIPGKDKVELREGSSENISINLSANCAMVGDLTIKYPENLKVSVEGIDGDQENRTLNLPLSVDNSLEFEIRALKSGSSRINLTFSSGGQEFRCQIDVIVLEARGGEIWPIIAILVVFMVGVATVYAIMVRRRKMEG